MTDHPPGFFQGTEMPTAGWWEALWPDPAGALAAVGLRPGMDVIDLCSGDGWFTLQIAKIARHVSAIDIDPHFLEVARHRLAENGATNCEFIAGDAYDIAKLAGPADFVFMTNAFHGVPDRPRLAKAVNAALKSNGQFAIVNWHKRPRDETPILGEPRGPKTELRMSLQETIKSVETDGLKFSKVVEIPPYQSFLSVRGEIYCAAATRNPPLLAFVLNRNLIVGNMIETSTITCPKCGHREAERMPTDACQFFYDCKGCGERLKPRPGDCCVFCSYGSVPCPPVQSGYCCN